MSDSAASWVIKKFTWANLKSVLKTYFDAFYIEPYICVREELASGTAGGAFTSGAWQTRALNTEVHDTSGIASLSSNKVSLPAGTYRFRATAPGFYVAQHKCRLYNVTDAATISVGTSEISSATSTGWQTRSMVSGRFTIAGTKEISLQHQCTTTQSINGYGIASSYGVAEVYAELELWKES